MRNSALAACRRALRKRSGTKIFAHIAEPAKAMNAASNGPKRVTITPAPQLVAALRPAMVRSGSSESNFTCVDGTRWKPEVGHVPRGWIGAQGSVKDVRLVLVTAEPGEPGQGDSYTNLDPDVLISEVTSAANKVLANPELMIRDNGKSCPTYHQNLRHILDYCYPGLSLDEQLRHTWITPSVLCSAEQSCGPVSSKIEMACSVNLRRQLAVLPKVFVATLGGKARHRLRNANIYTHAHAFHPTPRVSKEIMHASWRELGAAFHGWLAKHPTHMFAGEHS